jgi:hypothetical protein
MLFSLVMNVDARPGLGGEENLLEHHRPRIYLPENLTTTENTWHVDTKDHSFETNVVLPVELNGKITFIPVVPILDEDNGVVGYMCWVDPRKDIRPDLARDASVELGKLKSELPKSVYYLHRAPSGKSRDLSDDSDKIAGVGRFISNTFERCSTEEAEEIMEDPELGWATLHTKITTGKKLNGIKLFPAQVNVVGSIMTMCQAIDDDIYSTGGTVGAMREGICQIKVSNGESVDPSDIPVVVLGIEVVDKELTKDYKAPKNVHGVFVFPVITDDIVRTSTGASLDLREHTRVLR